MSYGFYLFHGLSPLEHLFHHVIPAQCLDPWDALRLYCSRTGPVVSERTIKTKHNTQSVHLAVMNTTCYSDARILQPVELQVETNYQRARERCSESCLDRRPPSWDLFSDLKIFLSFAIKSMLNISGMAPICNTTFKFLLGHWERFFPDSFHSRSSLDADNVKGCVHV